MILFIFTEFICKQRFLTLRSFSNGVVIKLLCLPVLVVSRISAVLNSFPEYVKTYWENTFESILTNSPVLFTYPSFLCYLICCSIMHLQKHSLHSSCLQASHSWGRVPQGTVRFVRSLQCLLPGHSTWKAILLSMDTKACCLCKAAYNVIAMSDLSEYCCKYAGVCVPLCWQIEIKNADVPVVMRFTRLREWLEAWFVL